MALVPELAEAAGRSGKVLHCFDCDQVCCKTAVIEVESPRSYRDYSDLLFYLYHHDTQIIVARNGRKKEWYVEFMSACRHLDPQGRCSIYDKRPLVCREYDMNFCERNTRHPFVYLRTPDDFYDYLKNQGRTRIFEKLSQTHRFPDSSPPGSTRTKSMGGARRVTL